MRLTSALEILVPTILRYLRPLNLRETTLRILPFLLNFHQYWNSGKVTFPSPLVSISFMHYIIGRPYLGHFLLGELLAHLLGDLLELGQLNGAAVVLVELLENGEQIFLVDLGLSFLHQNKTDKLKLNYPRKKNRPSGRTLYGFSN